MAKQKDDQVNTEEENKKSEELENRLKEVEDNYKRALADYQNLQRRTHEERSEIIKASNKELLLKVLPILDTLMMAQKHKNEEGITVAIDQFLQVLKSEGVEKIETEGKKFDPGLMECIATDKGEEGSVLEELKPGFKLYDKVLRPAMVKVGKSN